MSHTHQALTDVRDERARQEQLLEDGTIPWNCADPDVPDAAKLAVLVEEVGEVAKAMLDGDHGNAGAHHVRAQLHDELVQVAAVAVAWAEALT